MRKILLAVQQLHATHILHSDLKPENILIDKSGHIKLIDFGFAKMLKNIKKDRAYTNCGTPGYCAPEVMLDAGHTYKADIWSVAVTLFTAATGDFSFDSEDESFYDRVPSLSTASNPKTFHLTF